MLYEMHSRHGVNVSVDVRLPASLLMLLSELCTYTSLRAWLRFAGHTHAESYQALFSRTRDGVYLQQLLPVLQPDYEHTLSCIMEKQSLWADALTIHSARHSNAKVRG
jgi:hypothetical protein